MSSDQPEPRKSEQLAVIISFLDDTRRLIAALKVQRWDEVKWVVGIDLALAAASGASYYVDHKNHTQS